MTIDRERVRRLILPAVLAVILVLTVAYCVTPDGPASAPMTPTSASVDGATPVVILTAAPTGTARLPVPAPPRGPTLTFTPLATATGLPPSATAAWPAGVLVPTAELPPTPMFRPVPAPRQVPR